jgi:hypothetical protein
LLRGSFVPLTEIQDLRDLTRYRVELTQAQNRVANRIQKVLEQANIKLSSVASDTLGVSGLQMIEAASTANPRTAKGFGWTRPATPPLSVTRAPDRMESIG